MLVSYSIFFTSHSPVWKKKKFIFFIIVTELCRIIHRFTLLSVTDEIEALPLANTPEVMGLHSNAEIGYFTQAAKDMWTHLIDLQPQTGMIWHLSSLLPLIDFKRRNSTVPCPPPHGVLSAEENSWK